MISHLARIGAPVLAVLVIAGCGSSSSTTSTTSSTPTTTAAGPTATDAAIAAKVPAAIKSKGTLVVGTEAQYAPNEFLASDGHTIIGMDPDLVTALAETMGLKAKFNDAQFEAIIPGIQAGRYDLGRLLVHRHQGTREEGRLRHLLQRRHLLLREDGHEPGRRKA